MKKSYLFHTQGEILKLVKEKKLENKTLKEMAEVAGIKSPQVLKHHINKLSAKGFITYDKAEKSIFLLEEKANLISIPVMGSANAGEPVLIADNLIEGYLQVSSNIIGSKNKENVFAIRVVGDSMNKEKMNGEAIKDGNYVLVEEGNLAENGDIVVSLFNNTVANIKKFKKQGNNTILISNSMSHSKYPPILIDGADTLHILGRVWHNVST